MVANMTCLTYTLIYTLNKMNTLENGFMFAVVVSLTLKPQCSQEFLPLMMANARSSLSREKGCRQFDVATDPSRPDEVFLYELYDDATAFQHHLASGHFRSFDLATASMIEEKTVKTYCEVAQ